MNNLVEKIKELLKHSKREWLELYRLLTEAKEKEIWKEEGFKSWNAFIKGIAEEAGVTPNHVYKIMRAGKTADELKKMGVDAEKLGINKLDKFDQVRKRDEKLADELVKSGELERIKLKELDALAKGEKKEIQKDSEAPFPLHIAQNLQKRIEELEKRVEELEKRMESDRKKKPNMNEDSYLDDILGGDL